MGKRLNVLDIGDLFGYPVARILEPIGGVEVLFRDLPTIKAHIDEVDLVCFGGGQDICPTLYGHKNYGSQCGEQPSMRDLFEIEVWKLCQTYKIPILGICRGSQFACVMSGGSLIQDIGPHHGSRNEHLLTTVNGLQILMTTTHHQMMWPKRAKHQLLAWVDQKIGSKYWSYDTEKLSLEEPQLKDIEIVFFPKTRALAVQGHPEYYPSMNHPSVQYVQKLVQQFLLN